MKVSKDSRILHSIYLQWLLVHAFPQLREWPIHEWPEALDRAVIFGFDVLEHMGIVASVVFLTWYLQPQPEPGVSIKAVYAKQLLLSVPCFVVLAGPFFLRRIRRGLDKIAALNKLLSK